VFAPPREQQKIETIKRKTGIKETTEVIRYLISAKSDEIKKEENPDSKE
jgi:hypothetical protein